MKKQLAIATGLMLLATGAHATKSRMNALGQDSARGSHYLNDTRNVFRNAANINTMNNYVVTEWGTAASTVSSASSPAAEGGFARSAGNFNYGVYLGSDINSHNGQRATGTGYAGTATMGSGSFQMSDNEVDLFFGGDMGLQWGANLHYASGKTEAPATTKKEHSALGLGVGVMMGDLAASLNLGLKDESTFDGTTAGTKFENDGDMNFNVSYKMGANAFFVEYDKLGAKYNNGTATATTEKTTITVGAGHVKEVSNTARINMDVSYVKTDAEDKTAAGVKTEVNSSKLPLTVGFEVDANSWLVLRGSIKQNFFIGTTETKSTTTTKSSVANSTVVQAGATLNFGKLKVDGAIGTTSAGGSAGSNTNDGTLRTDALLTTVAVHYWF